MERGAKSTLGIDISDNMIQSALRQQDHAPVHGLDYRVADLRVDPLPSEGSYDLILAVFLFNYHDCRRDASHDGPRIFKTREGRSPDIFRFPIRLFPFLKQKEFPFYFDPSGGYFSGRNQCFPGEIWRLDRTPVKVQCVHKLLGDYFAGLKVRRLRQHA